MDALRKSLIVAVALISVLCIIPLGDEGSDGAGSLNGLMIYEVAHGTPDGVSLYNYSGQDIDLSGYLISDQPRISGGNEGRIVFNDTLVLRPGERITVVSEVSPQIIFTNRDNTYSWSDNDVGISTSGKFNISNSGDDIYLYRTDGTLVDAMCYGDKTIDEAGIWSGDPVRIPTNGFVQRTGTANTGSAADWKIPGTLGLEFDPDLRFDADVTPFLFPDSGGIPVYQTLEGATESIQIEIYMITSLNLYALLSEKASQGVSVQLLLEGNNLNDNLDAYLPYIQMLVDSGGDVRMIGVASDGNFDRYTFVHAKYAIVDGDTVIVTSENWTQNNLNGSIDYDPYDSTDRDGNRGWGVIVRSTGYADYMEDVFLNDWSMDYGDVKEFGDLYGGQYSATVTYESPDDVSFRAYSGVEVTPVLSNDNSYDALEYYIGSATERFYSQQQSLGDSYANLYEGYPLRMVADIASNVECKLIFNSDVKADVLETLNTSTSVEVASMSKPTVHNKGIVSDDSVWVSSINWTSTSFHQNREVAVVIHDKEIADYYADAFLSDFQKYYTYDGLRIDMTEIEESYTAGEEITLTVQVHNGSGDYTYYWDLGDGSDTIESDVPRIVCKPAWNGEAATVYTLKVTVVDNASPDVTGVATATYTITAPVDDPDDSGLGQIGELLGEYMYLIIPVLVIVLAIAGAVSRSGKKKRR